jgi:hypothetical protein
MTLRSSSLISSQPSRARDRGAGLRHNLPRCNGSNRRLRRRGNRRALAARKPGSPAPDRAGPFLGTCPGNVAEILAGAPSELFVGGQAHHRIGIAQAAHQRGHDLSIGLPPSQTDRAGTCQRCRILDLIKAARTMCAAPRLEQHDEHRHLRDRSPDPHAALPWLVEAIAKYPRPQRSAGSLPWESRRTLVKPGESGNPKTTTRRAPKRRTSNSPRLNRQRRR